MGGIARGVDQGFERVGLRAMQLRLDLAPKFLDPVQLKRDGGNHHTLMAPLDARVQPLFYHLESCATETADSPRSTATNIFFRVATGISMPWPTRLDASMTNGTQSRKFL